MVNEEASGDIAELQSVIKQLRGELEMFHEGTADPFVELKQRLERCGPWGSALGQ